MSGVHEEHVAGARDSRIEGRLELGFEEFSLVGDVLGQRLLGGMGTARVRCQVNPNPARNVRVWVRPRRNPVNSAMRCGPTVR